MHAGDTEGHRPDLTPSLVVRLRAGDATAGSLLNDLYREPMLRFCWGYLENEQDAEDAVQEVFCKVLKTGGVPENFRAWLYKLTRRHCLNVRRSRARRRDAASLPSESRLGAGQTGNLTRLVRDEKRARIVQLLDTLPADQREMLRMRYMERLSRDEIAYVLDVPKSVVKSRLFEGAQRLREHTSLLGD